jgi:hypothetical protein
MRIMVTAKSSLNGGVRRGGRACSTSTGNPIEDMAISSQSNTASTPNRASRTPTAQPIAIPDSGARRRYGSPRSVQSGSPRSHSYASSKSSPNRASPSTTMDFSMLVPSSVRLQRRPVFLNLHLTGPLQMQHTTKNSSKKYPISWRCSSTSRPKNAQSSISYIPYSHTYLAHYHLFINSSLSPSECSLYQKENKRDSAFAEDLRI